MVCYWRGMRCADSFGIVYQYLKGEIMRGFNHSHMFDIIESKRWQHDDGRTASLYGAVPYQSDPSGWHVITVGWTVRHKKTGIIGIGRKPWETRQEAEDWLHGRG